VKVRNLLVSLPEKTVESVAAAIMTFLISNFFMLPGGYLSLQYRSQSAEVRKEIIEFHISKTTFKRIEGQVKDMANVYHSGWFSRDREVEKEVDIFDHVFSDLQANNLEEHFVIDSHLWSQEAITQLSQERGKIKGYAFQDEVHKSLQTHLVALYDAHINIIKEIDEIIWGWQNQTNGERRQRLGKVQKELGKNIGAINALSSAVDQQIALLKAKDEEMRLRYLDLKEKRDGLRTRKTLAVLAVSLGALVLVTLIIGVILVHKSKNRSLT